jgi:hypothetical protein
MTLNHYPVHVSVSEMLNRLRTRNLAPAGPIGGPAWTSQQQALLLSSLEAGWPIGALVAWAPTGRVRDPWHVLDGHRRLAVLSQLQRPGSGIVRDLRTDEAAGGPAYRSSPPGEPTAGRLPVAAMASTLRFLAATHGWDEPHLNRAHVACSRLLHAGVTVLLLVGGAPEEVTQAGQRLLPGRVDPDTIRAIRFP